MADELINKGFGVISSVLKKRVERGKASQKEMDEILGRIKGSKNMDDLGDCDLVIEAVTEDLTLKKTMFEALDRICPAHAILATNTSVLSVTQIAVATKRPEKILGLHFAQPVPVMKLVEVIRTPATSDETMAIARDFCKAIGKDVVIAKDTPGFISNRSTSIYLLNAVRNARGRLCLGGRHRQDPYNGPGPSDGSSGAARYDGAGYCLAWGDRHI